MASHLRLRQLAFVVVAVLIVAASPAFAIEEGSNASAASEGNGIDVVFTHNADGTNTAPSRGGSSCTWSAREIDPVAASRSGAVPDQPSPDARLYLVYCNDEYRGLAWLAPRNFSNAASQPLTEELVRRIEVLPATVDVRPQNRGVTGIPSLFWVEGYDGQPITESLSAFGLTVTVNAAMTDVVWDFGDGTPPVHGSLGEAWPQRSSVQHDYADPSPAGGYHVTVRVTLTPTFTVNGAGAATPLAPIVLTFTRDYVVHEVQAVRNA